MDIEEKAVGDPSNQIMMMLECEIDKKELTDTKENVSLFIKSSKSANGSNKIFPDIFLNTHAFKQIQTLVKAFNLQLGC